MGKPLLIRLPGTSSWGLSHADRVSMLPSGGRGSDACADPRIPGARLWRELRFLHLGRRVCADQPDAGESEDHHGGQWPGARGRRGLPWELHRSIRLRDPGSSGRRSRFGSVLRRVVRCVQWDGRVRSDPGRRPRGGRHLRDATASSAEPAPPERDRPRQRSRDLFARRPRLRFLDLRRRLRRRRLGDAHGHRSQ